MSTSSELYLQALRRAGYRITAQRRAVCDYLAATRRHPTPYQVFDELSAAHPDISRATVYNTLNVLQQLGVIVEIALGANHTHYDTDPTPHINLICLRCHNIHDYDAQLPLSQLQEQIERETDFQPVSTRVDIVGFCVDCREQRKAEIVAQWRAQNEPSAKENGV